ncbi:protein YgfX [Photobacterium kagoshimensis]|uniref:protein YgfX n=1 Tax=Photobacterium kagoshimensis TaxID=2910242 RepID=UPI003D0F2510
MAALHITYVCVAIFLCIVASHSMTAGLIAALFLDGLLTEWLSHTNTLWQQQGRLHINEYGDIRWQRGQERQAGQLTQIPLQTSYLIVFIVTFPACTQQYKTQQYFVIDRCCCCDHDFRTLSLYIRSIITFK